MSAHDHPGLSDVAYLAVAVAFLQRVLSVHEIASCHFDLGSASSMSESAAGCVVRGLLVEGSSGEGRAFSAAMRAATRHAPFLLRQLAHFSSFGASRGHVPSFLAASLRFIGAKRPFAPRGHLRTAQLRTQRITEMRGNGRHSCVRTFRRSGARPGPSLCATQTMNADVQF